MTRCASVFLLPLTLRAATLATVAAVVRRHARKSILEQNISILEQNTTRSSVISDNAWQMIHSKIQEEAALPAGTQAAFLLKQNVAISIWNQMAQHADEQNRNICIGGKQVPDFYMIGVQKCATSSLAEMLSGAGISHVHGDRNPKEFHWFDHRADYTLGKGGWQKNREDWLAWMPTCLEPPIHLTETGAETSLSNRRPLADFTPDYFRIVPRPEDFVAQGHEWMPSQKMDIMAPHKMASMYGPENVKHLRFALMIREPLSQMQSAWYHAESFNFTNGCRSCKAKSFKQALNRVLNKVRKDPPELSPWLWTTMYGRQMENWLQEFQASQFYIIPMRQLTSDKKDGICKDLSERVNFEADCDSKGRNALHAWSHDHPEVDEDAGIQHRKAFDDFMDQENERLVSLLAKSNVQGMGLANYEGDAGDVDSIRNWLKSSW